MLKLLPAKTSQKTTINLDELAGNYVVLFAIGNALSDTFDVPFAPVGGTTSLNARQNIVREMNKKFGKYVDLVTTDRKLIAECS